VNSAAPHQHKLKAFRLSAARAAMFYTGFAILWIIISSYLLKITVSDPLVHGRIELAEGLMLVVVTGVLLYLLLKNSRASIGDTTGVNIETIHPSSFGRLMLLIATLAMIAPLIGLVIAKIYVPQTEQDTYQSLEAIAKLKTDEISSWIGERDSDTRALAADTGFARLVEQYTRHSMRNSQLLKQIQQQLDPLHSIYGYDSILLLGTNGIILTSIGNDIDMPPLQKKLFSKALHTKQIVRSDLYRDISDRINIDWMVPIIISGQQGKRTVAMLVLRVAPNHFLYPLIQSWPTTSTSAETLLVRSEGKSVLFLNELRHHKDSALKLKLPLTDSGLPAAIAIANGHSGIVQGKDYRGVEVLAAYHPVVDTDWYIIAKIDHDEILQPVWRMLQWVMLISFIAIGAIMVLLLRLWRQQQDTHRLELLAHSANTIEESERRFRAVTTSATEAIVSSDSASKIVSWNPGAERMFGYSEAEIIGQPLTVLMPQPYRERHPGIVSKVAATGASHVTGTTRELVGLRKDGNEFPLELSLAKWETSTDTFFTAIIRDISNRKANEEKIQRLTQLYAALSQCNKAIVHCRNEPELFDQVCQIAVKFGGMQMAWVGMIDSDGTRVQLVAKAGSHTEYLDDINIVMDADSPYGQGPVGAAIRENHPYWCDDFMHDPITLPWRDRGKEAGWIAVASLPLRKEGKVVGAFNLYWAETNSFDEAARELLLEMTRDISYAIDNLAREEKREQAEQQTRALSQRYQAVMQTSIDGVHVMDAQGNVIEANDAFCHMLGYTQDEMAQLNVTDWDAQWSREELDNAFSEFVGKSALIETVHRHKDGTLINVEISASGVELDGNNYFFGSSRDITERKQIEQDLRIAATAFEIQEGILVTDENLVILRVNKAFSKLFGYSEEEVIGQTPVLIKSDNHDDLFYQEMWSTLNCDHYWQGEIWNKRKDGEVNPYWVTITAVISDQGDITNYVSAYSDLSQYKKDEAEIHSLAFYDQLTSLPNRRLLLSRLTQTFNASSHHKHYGAMMFIDLDNFKGLNDTRGHMVGDLLLIEVAQRLQKAVRDDDIVARLGGDEFVVVLEKLSVDPMQAAAQANIVCDKILTAIRQPYSLLDDEYHGSTSIGISLFRGHETSVDELLKHADIAMYHAKSDGRNTLRFYDPDMQAELEARTTLENDLHNALIENQFMLHYQMQVDDSGHIVGAEALIRWQHPQRGMVSPMEFIPLAEDTGLITLIGQWVLETTCIQLKAWETEPMARDLKLAVNVSARQFHQDDFVEQVVQVIRNHAINPDRLKLELTETLVLDNVEDTIIKMHALKKTGVLFSMDDFGTGYSSLAYLTQLPLNQLKIDQSFVRNIVGKKSDAVIVQTIIGMAQSLGIEVIAEGVETKDQHALLKEYGCYLYQGYLFGKPLPIDEFEEELKRLS
jgi:diguanylate cyclase (GGDEF)-like protein/PAS domain S-box-containing protein